MSNRPEKKQTGHVNYIWVLAGGYLLYTAYNLVRNLISGKSDNVLLVIVFAALFSVVGAALLLREWRAYKYGMDHIDDPSSWCDDEAEDEELEKLISEASSAGSSVEDIGSETEGEEAAE